MSINVLILSAGRRVELVQLFKNSAIDYDGKVIAGDMSDTAPALYFADAFEMLPRISDPSYIDAIINISKKHNISLIVPTIDTELIKLSLAKEQIETETNAKVLISNKDFIALCRDKIAFQKEIERIGFKMPKLIEKVDTNTVFPIFMKPISGSSSINAYKVDSFEDYLSLSKIIPNAMIQDCVVGDEYTVDVFLDFDSNIISVVPRLRLATRSGEIAKGKIVKDRSVINEVTNLINIIKPIGHITVQLIKNDIGIYFIEINPRFGGGAPMSINSGANSCLNLFKLLDGQTLEYTEDYNDGDIHLRFDQSIILRDGKRAK